MGSNIQTVIRFVGSVFVLSLLGIVALALLDKGVPDVLQNVAVGSMTLLGGLLVPSNGKADLEH